MNGNDRFLNINDAHLRVTGGNVHASSFNLDQISITTTSTTASTIDFLNETTAFTARSNIEVGTANLFVNTETSNVGIGTDAPEYTLDVHGTANVSVLTASSNVGVGTFSPEYALDVHGTANVGALTATTFSGIGTSLTALNAGNITSGTLDTAHVPSLDASKITGGTLPVSRGGTGTTSSTGSGALVLKDAPAFTGDATFDTNTLKIDAINNRVGIGTTTPGRFLEVYTGDGNVPGIRLRRGTGSAYTDLHHAGVNVPGTGDLEGLAIITSDGNATTQEVMRICGNGNVGIGTSNPSSIFNTYGGGLWDGTDHTSKVCATLQVGRGSGAGASVQDSGTGAILEFRHASDYRFVTIESVSEGNYSSDIGIRFKTTDGSAGPQERVRIDAHGNVGIGTTSPNNADLVIKQSGDVNDASRSSGIRMYRADNDTNSWHFGMSSGSNIDFQYNNSSKGYLGRSDVGIISFTGQHRNIIRGITPEGINELQGLIVSANTNKYIKINNGLETGSNAITINESIPIVSLSNVVIDKTCFGVISASEDPEERSDAYGNFVTPFEKEKGDTRVFINSLGEGAIWVTNINGPLESGDYITTSTVKGYGQKQDSEFLANYTVAKITMDCDFDPATQPVQVIKKDEDGENVLDEHGQIQWEDHPTGTEKAYKIRYLDANGNITDEANAVHTAAFVGCTYHCG